MTHNQDSEKRITDIMSNDRRYEENKLDFIADQVKAIFELLNGKDGNLGMLQKVAVMWRVHVWLLCTASASFGAISILILRHYFFPNQF